MLGDAERITSVVPKGSIDYVVDVESSIFYPNKEAFLREVSQVLKEDGSFFYATLIPKGKMTILYSYIKRYFEIEKEEDITDNVVRSLKLDSQSVSSFIERNFPWCKDKFIIITHYSRKFLLETIMGY